MTQKYRHRIEEPVENLDQISDELKQLVDSGAYPTSDYQNRKMHVITKTFLLPESIMKYLRGK